MSSFSFIHAADLHLDSPFSSLGQDNPDLAAIMHSATFQAFDNIIQLCLDYQVDFLLVAGDVYDGADRSLRAQIRFRDGLKKLADAGIQSFIVHGNHDPISGWSSTLEWPNEVYLFNDKLTDISVKRDGRLLTHIQGISYPEREEHRNLSNFFYRNSDSFHIGLLHANVGNDTGHEPYAPCSLDDLVKAEMDYWALGHVHARKRVSEGFPVIIYPGNTQGCNIREAGEKGCYLVNVDENRDVKTEFIPVDVVRWSAVSVSIDDIKTEQELINCLMDTCSHIAETSSGRGSIARVSIVGNGPVYNALVVPNALSDLLELLQESGYSLSPFVWVEKIALEAGPEIDLDDLIEKRDFLGELLRYSNDISGYNLAALLRDELSPLFENPRARRFLDLPDEDKLKRLLKEAEKICVRNLYYSEDE